MTTKLTVKPMMALYGIKVGCIYLILLALGTGLAADDTDVAQDAFHEAVNAVRDKDFALATELFLVLAEQDDHDAQFNLAILLQSGQGTPQNFTIALEWAFLAKLGGVEPAADLAEALMGKVLPITQTEVAIRIDEHLQARLAAGERAAIMQYVAFNRTKYENPDLETAYIWSLIGAALSVSGAAKVRDEIEGDLETRVILPAQDAAQKMFSEQNMVSLF
jgi:TPR repeat protein